MTYLFRHVLPQRKLKVEPDQSIAKHIAKEIFGEGNIKENTTNVFSKMPLAVFCEDGKRNGYKGDDVDGFPMKFCNKFFQTPSDVGFCMTKNLDINNIIRAEYLDEFSDFMAIEKQGQGIQALRGTYSSESTDILMTNIFNDDQSLSYRNVSYV